MLKKKIVIPALTVVILGFAVIFSTTLVMAQSSQNNRFSKLVDAISQKFNLDKSKVQAVFDDYRSQQKEDMQKRLEDRLSQTVKDGKLTESQKQAILGEVAKLKSEYPAESLKNMTQEERLKLMQKRQEEIRAWAKSTGIDPSYFMPGFGMRRAAGFWNGPKATPIP